MTCSNFTRYQVDGKRDGGNFLISGTSGKGEIFSLLRIKLKNYSHSKLMNTLILFCSWLKA
jgi:hypothetical protein